MAYRLTYQAQLTWVGPGTGPATQQAAQSLGVGNTLLGQGSNTFLAADIAALTNAMAADISAQLTAKQGVAQSWASGATVSAGAGPAGGNL